MANETPRLTKTEFVAQHVDGKTDRELLEQMSWAAYQSLQIGIDNANRLTKLQRDVDRMEQEAKDMMGGMGNPADMMKTITEMMG